VRSVTISVACFFGHAIHSFAAGVSWVVILVMSVSRSFQVLVNQMTMSGFSLGVLVMVSFGSLPRVSSKSGGGLISAIVVFGLMPSFFARGVSLYCSNIEVGTTATFGGWASVCLSVVWIWLYSVYVASGSCVLMWASFCGSPSTKTIGTLRVALLWRMVMAMSRPCMGSLVKSMIMASGGLFFSSLSF